MLVLTIDARLDRKIKQANKPPLFQAKSRPTTKREEEDYHVMNMYVYIYMYLKSWKDEIKEIAHAFLPCLDRPKQP